MDPANLRMRDYLPQLGCLNRPAIRGVAIQCMRAALSRPIGLAVTGLVTGVIFSLWAASALAPLLFGVEPRDPVTLAIVVAAVLVVTIVAAYLPARRIVRIDPTESLGAE